MYDLTGPIVVGVEKKLFLLLQLSSPISIIPLSFSGIRDDRPAGNARRGSAAKPATAIAPTALLLSLLSEQAAEPELLPIEKLTAAPQARLDALASTGKSYGTHAQGRRPDPRESEKRPDAFGQTNSPDRCQYSRIRFPKPDPHRRSGDDHCGPRTACRCHRARTDRGAGHRGRGPLSAKKRALAIADNRIALNAGWNIEILALELQELSTLDIDFDLEVIGFDTAEIDILIDGPRRKPAPMPADQVVAIPAVAVSRPGDLWLLGEHKLLCGDAREAECFAALMGEERAGVVFTDPPYNVRVDGHVCGSGKITHREFAMASGEMSKSEFIDFLTRTLGNAAQVSLDGAIHFVCMDWRHMGEIITAGRAVYAEMKNLCVWNKNNGGMGSFYRSKHELVFVFKVGAGPHQNTIQLGRSGRYRCNVWDYPGVNTMRRGRLEDLGMHPTTKPVALVADALKDCSRRRDIVLDPFAGSGTTVMAAQKTGRRARVMEIDALYTDVSLRRWETYTQRDAVHQATGCTFAEIAAQRGIPPADREAATQARK